MALKTYSASDIESLQEAPGGTGVAAVIREELSDVEPGQAIQLSELTELVAEKTGKPKGRLGAQIRQTCERLGELVTKQTNNGRRTFLIMGEAKNSSKTVGSPGVVNTQKPASKK